MSTDYYTENLAEFGYREYQELQKILKAWFEGDGLPNLFEGDGIKPALNKNSGYVFLTNDDYQVAMLDEDGDLRLFHSCPECGQEGFDYDLREHGNECCNEYLNEIYS